MEKEYVVELTQEEVEEIEKEVQQSTTPQKTNEFIIFPNEKEKTLIIGTLPEGCDLELDKQRCIVLIDLLNHRLSL